MDCRPFWIPCENLEDNRGDFVVLIKSRFRDFVNNHPKEAIQLKSQWKMLAEFWTCLNHFLPLEIKKDACHPRKSSPQKPTKNHKKGVSSKPCSLWNSSNLLVWSNLEPPNTWVFNVHPPRSFVCLKKNPITYHHPWETPKKKQHGLLDLHIAIDSTWGLVSAWKPQKCQVFFKSRVQNVRVFPSLCLLLPVSQRQNRRLKVSITSVQWNKN